MTDLQKEHSARQNTVSASSLQHKPLSPHLQIWRWHATMFSSILHRATGALLYSGSIGLVFWLWALARGGTLYRITEQVLLSFPGQIFLCALVYASFYHLINGIRHLIWDMGTGFNAKQANFLSLFIFFLSALCSFVFWAFAFFLRGGFSS